MYSSTGLLYANEHLQYSAKPLCKSPILPHKTSYFYLCSLGVFLLKESSSPSGEEVMRDPSIHCADLGFRQQSQRPDLEDVAVREKSRKKQTYFSLSLLKQLDNHCLRIRKKNKAIANLKPSSVI